MLPEIRDYDAMVAAFQWRVPDRYNIGVDVCDRWAAVAPARPAIIEVDGDQHGQETSRRYDAMRTARLERDGFRVLRFWNHEVLKTDEREAVFDTIADALGVS